MTPKDELQTIWRAALAAADPFQAVIAALPPKPEGKVALVAAGKAAGRMAEAVESVWGPLPGVVVAPAGYGRPLQGPDMIEARHPVPDDLGAKAAERALEIAAGLGEGDMLLALISGGGSALLSKPAEGVSVEEKRRINKALLASGAPIQEMNRVRKSLSAIKGGRLLAAARPAQVVTLLVSDVVGDEAEVIASGPTLPDRGETAEALAILDRYGIEASAEMRAIMAANFSPKVDVAGDVLEIVVRPMDVLRAAGTAAEGLGYGVLNLGDAIEGRAMDVGRVLAGMARSVRLHCAPCPAPLAILSGGETTVVVPKGATGKGGRNTECALGFALAAEGIGAAALFADTDGIDGASGGAGAFALPDALARMRAAGVDAAAALDGADSATAFAAIGDLFATGPTATNVNDLRVILLR
jgi:hydroxypyruvate reductase